MSSPTPSQHEPPRHRPQAGTPATVSPGYAPKHWASNSSRRCWSTTSPTPPARSARWKHRTRIARFGDLGRSRDRQPHVNRVDCCDRLQLSQYDGYSWGIGPCPASGACATVMLVLRPGRLARAATAAMEAPHPARCRQCTGSRMGNNVRYSASTDKAGGRIGCPRCGNDVVRIPRRLLDRLYSLFVPVHRYRCRQHACQWEGRIKVSDPAATRRAPH